MDSQVFCRLRRVKSFQFGSLLHTNLQSNIPGLGNVKRLIRVEFRDPNVYYELIQKMGPSEGDIVRYQTNRHLAVLRESFSIAPLKMLESFAHIQHANVTDLLDVFFHDGRLWIASEFLDLSLVELEVKMLPIEEWEIATVVAEVIRGMSYLVDNFPEHELHIGSVRFSLHGEVKLVPDFCYQHPSEGYTSDNLFNSAFLVEVLGCMINFQSEGQWSKEMVEFSSMPTSNSLEPFIQHPFLSQSSHPSKLIPRIRLAMRLLSMSDTYEV